MGISSGHNNQDQTRSARSGGKPVSQASRWGWEGESGRYQMAQEQSQYCCRVAQARAKHQSFRFKATARWRGSLHWGSLAASSSWTRDLSSKLASHLHLKLLTSSKLNSYKNQILYLEKKKNRRWFWVENSSHLMFCMEVHVNHRGGNFKHGIFLTA